MSGLRNVPEGLQDFANWAADTRPRVGLNLPFFDTRSRGGLAKAECLMVLAYSSVGKTWLALNTIASNPTVPTLFFSIEMSWRQVVSRLTAIGTGVSTWHLEEQIKAGNKPSQLLDTMQRFPLLLGDDSSDMSIKTMGSQIHAASLRLNQPIRLVVIDYLELISGSGLLGKSEQIDRAAQKVRALAKDHDCSVIILHQVSKGDGGGGHEPLALDSGKYGGHHPMDYVLGAYAPRLDKSLSPIEVKSVECDLYLQLLKNRNGMAHPAGVKHRLSPETGAITPEGFIPSGYGVQTDMFKELGYAEHSLEEVWS